MTSYTYFDKETTVHGELTTDDLVVEGSFNGEIKAREKVLLKTTAQIEASIEASKLMVEEGAIINGHITLRNGEKK